MGISYGGISQLFTAADQPAEPRRDHAALGARPDADDALPRRHPQHRLRRRAGRRSGSTTPCPPVPTAASPGPTSRSRSGDDDLHRRTRRCTPRRSTCWRRSATTTTTARRSPTRSRRSPSSTRSTCPTFMACQWTDEQTGGHCPTLADALHRHRQEVVHLHERHPRRLARPRDLQPLVRLPQALRGQAGADHRGGRRSRPPRRSSTRRRWGSRGVTLPPDPIQQQPTYDGRAGGVRERSRRSGSCSTTAPAARARASPTRASSARSRASRSRAPRRAPGSSATTARSATRRPPTQAASGFTWDAARAAADQLHRQHRRRRAALDRDPDLPVDAGSRRGNAVSYADRAAGRGHDRARRRRRATSGSAPRSRTSTCR